MIRKGSELHFLQTSLRPQTPCHQLPPPYAAEFSLLSHVTPSHWRRLREGLVLSCPSFLHFSVCSTCPAPGPPHAHCLPAPAYTCSQSHPSPTSGCPASLAPPQTHPDSRGPITGSRDGGWTLRHLRQAPLPHPHTGSRPPGFPQVPLIVACLN